MPQMQTPKPEAPKSEAHEHFLGKVCHGCGSGKPIRSVFCRACYTKLPEAMAADLSQKFGNGFEQAYDRARDYLGEQKGE